MISCSACLARGCRLFGSLSRTLASRWTQHRCSAVSGHASRTAAQKPRAPSPIARTGALEIPDHGAPALGALPVAVLQGDHFLGAVRSDPNEHERTQAFVLQTDREVDAVGPEVDVIPLRE